MRPNLWEQGKTREIQWNEGEMASGFPAIDEQHKEWIARFNQFDQAIAQSKGTEACSEALLFFLRYSETHFHFEEDIMKQFHCSSESLNREEHRKFQARIHETIYKTWPSGATEFEVRALRTQLADWLVHHICCVDLKLRDVTPAA